MPEALAPCSRARIEYGRDFRIGESPQAHVIDAVTAECAAGSYASRRAIGRKIAC
jgi:hypothetical protein